MTPAKKRAASAGAGYSGTPLPKKLGIGAGARVAALGAPPGIEAILGPLPDGAELGRRLRRECDIVWLFAVRRRDLERQLERAQAAVRAGGSLWISWPKKTSGVASDITEDVLREVVLPTGWVDTKVCAVDATWSGLRFQRRRA